MHKRMTTLQYCLKCCRINIHGFNKDWYLTLFAHQVYVQIVQLADMSEEGNLKEILTNRKETIWKLSLAHMKFNSHTIEFVRQRNREYMTSTENWNEKSLQSLLSFLFKVQKFHAENHWRDFVPKCEQLTFIHCKQIKGFHPMVHLTLECGLSTKTDLCQPNLQFCAVFLTNFN